MADGTINNYCLVCGKGYNVCRYCRETREFTPWRTITDTMNCYKIFQILSNYNGHFIDKAEAKQQLASCDLSAKNTFKASSIRTIDEILGTSAKTVRQTPKTTVTKTPPKAKTQTESKTEAKSTAKTKADTKAETKADIDTQAKADTKTEIEKTKETL